MLVLGVSLGVPFLWGQGGLFARIVATVSPATQQLEIGDTVGDITNFATLTNVNNYTPTANTAVIQVNGVNATGATVLADGDVVTLLVTATDFPDFTFTIDDDVGAAPTSNGILTSELNAIFTSEGNALETLGA